MAFPNLPPLLTLETLLFRMIGAAFVFLTLTLVTGIAFSETLFGRALRFEHKTVFAVLSWLIFAWLLAGRWRYGWRGAPRCAGHSAASSCCCSPTSAAGSCSKCCCSAADGRRLAQLDDRRAGGAAHRVGFFSIAETSMMAINRYRLKHMVAQGHGGAAAAWNGC